MKRHGLEAARSGARYPTLGAAVLAAGLGACISGEGQPRIDASGTLGLGPVVDAAIDAPVPPDGAAPLPDAGIDAAADAANDATNDAANDSDGDAGPVTDAGG